MRRTIRFKRFLTAETVPGDAVYLFSEQPDQSRLQGQLIELLAPLLDGKHDRDELVAAASDFGARRVNQTLDRLLDRGFLAEVDADADERVGGYWEMCQVDGDAAVGALRDRSVELIRVGELPDDQFSAAAGAIGLRVDTDQPADLAVVLTDDYLNPELADLNSRNLAEGRPWLLAKAIGGTIWIGPVFEPGHTACWECLANRLGGNQLLMSYLRQRTGRTGVPVTSIADLPTTRMLAGHLTALHAAKWLTGALADDAGHTDIFTLNTATLFGRTHPLRRRPQCPACGDAALQARLQQEPVHVVSRPKAFTADGGHRAKTPDALLAEFEPLVSPITGTVKHLLRAPNSAEGLYTYHAGQNFAVPMANVGDLRAGLRSAACGKGMSDTQAKASALAEAIERYSGLYRGDEARAKATMAELGDAAIAPNEVHLFSERQYGNRAAWNAKGVHFQRVCDPFDPGQRIDWTPIWSLSAQRTRYLPTASLFFGYPVSPGNAYAGADSNGNAAGTCREDAILQGFLELVERDSVALWWYNMLRRPAIDLTTFDEPYFATWQERYRAANRETWALDLTSDLGIPSVVTVSRRIDKPRQDILIAFGAHFDVKVAISRAMTEMNQFLPAVLNVTAGSEEYLFPDPEQQHWWRNATLENQPYLMPVEGRSRTASDYYDLTTDDLAEDVRLAERIVARAGMEMLVLDQTRPDIGLPVVKVVVPGMRHFWTRFAPGRLYDIPVRMGWLDNPTAECNLNPIGMFL